MFAELEKGRWIKTFEKLQMVAEIKEMGDCFLITFFITLDSRGFAERIRQRKATSLADADVLISDMVFTILQEK